MNQFPPPYIQRGRGIGGILSSLFKAIFPAVKAVGKALVKSPITKQIVTAAKNQAIDAGLNIAADTLSGENVGQSVLHRLGIASKEVGKSVRPTKRRKKPLPTPPPPKKKKLRKIGKSYKKSKNRVPDIFDEYGNNVPI